MTADELIEAAQTTPKGEVEQLDLIVENAHFLLGELERTAPKLREAVKIARSKGATK